MSFQVPEAHSMREAALQAHEWYTSLVAAGFTEYQALCIVISAPVWPPQGESDAGEDDE